MKNIFAPLTDRLDRKHLLIIQIALVIAAVILLSFITIPLQLMNSYTSANYSGWQEHAVEGFAPFMLPEEWQLTLGEGDPAQWLPVTITHTSGKEVARGYLFPAGLTNDIFKSAALDFTGKPLTEYRILSENHLSLFSKGGSIHEGAFFSGSEKVHQAYCVKLAARPAEMHLWFTDVTEADLAALQEQYKAILWSLIF